VLQFGVRPLHGGSDVFHIEGDRGSVDSPVEATGFEPSVPLGEPFRLCADLAYWTVAPRGLCPSITHSLCMNHI
jgi:hypothetical protein